MPIDVVMPRMGMTMTEGTVLRWLKKPGDTVTKGEPIVEIMTDKVSAEVEAPADGVLAAIVQAEDAVVPVGEPLGSIARAGETVAAPPQPSTAPGPAAPPQAPAAAPVAAPAPVPGDGKAIQASPIARRVAKELGIDLATVQGTGPQGRIGEADVRRAAERSAPSAPPVPERREATPPTAVPVVSTQPVRGIRQVVAERMTQSFQTTPHFYLTVELDATALLQLRERLLKMPVADEGERVTVTDILVKLVAAALAEHRYANASWKDGSIQQLGQVNVGIAVATEQGLVVPVIRDADRKTFREVAKARHDVTARARQGKLTVEDVSGGTFTLSNLGMYGIDLFAGIINPPQSALLAVGKIKERPAVVDGEIRPRPMFYVTLSVDHRVMDGAEAATLLQHMASLIEQPALLVA